MNPQTVDLIVVDPCSSFRHDLRQYLNTVAGGIYRVVGEAGSAGEAVRLVKQHEPRLVLINATLGGIGTSGAVRVIQSRHARIRFILLCECPPQRTAHLVGEDYPSAYLLKSRYKATLITAIEQVTRNRRYVDDEILAYPRAKRSPSEESPIVIPSYSLEVFCAKDPLVQPLNPSYTHRLLGQSTEDGWRWQLYRYEGDTLRKCCLAEMPKVAQLLDEASFPLDTKQHHQLVDEIGSFEIRHPFKFLPKHEMCVAMGLIRRAKGQDPLVSEAMMTRYRDSLFEKLEVESESMFLWSAITSGLLAEEEVVSPEALWEDE